MFAMMMIFSLVGGCATEVPESECDELCSILVKDCEVKTFPSMDECESACAYGEEQGADILAYRVCMSSVDDCDTFGIVECENEHGW